jgi:hypothetical protein
MAVTVFVDHVGRIMTAPGGQLGGPTLMADEEYSEPFHCGVAHEHSDFCGVNRSFVIPRLYRRGLDSVYREELLPLDEMQSAQLTRRYEEVEAAWLALGERLEDMRVEIERRKASQ